LEATSHQALPANHFIALPPLRGTARGHAAMTGGSVGLFRAPRDIHSFSMDRYAVSLVRELQQFTDDGLSFHEIRPASGFTGPRLLNQTPLSRYWAKYLRYAVTAHSTAFAVNHILDHAYGNLVHVLDARRTIVTCHDLFPLLHWRNAIPGLARRRKRPVTFEVSVAGLRRARFVVSVSQSTRDDLINIVHVSPDRIHVVPSGIDPIFVPLDIDASRAAPGFWPVSTASIKRILCVDTGAPYKNVRATLETFGRVRARGTAGVQLVRVGPPLSPGDRLIARRLGIENGIMELGSIPENQMPLLYNSCDVLLFPSFYEGFGWPPLEAMACGLPVVISRAAALQEMAGPAALMADAQDYDGLADHVCHLINDEDEARAARVRGLAYVKQFSWKHAAELVRGLYLTVLAESC
jgi:glycosyltransferase involved in cell wall biosynthesis